MVRSLCYAQKPCFVHFLVYTRKGVVCAIAKLGAISKSKILPLRAPLRGSTACVPHSAQDDACAERLFSGSTAAGTCLRQGLTRGKIAMLRARALLCSFPRVRSERRICAIAKLGPITKSKILPLRAPLRGSTPVLRTRGKIAMLRALSLLCAFSRVHAKKGVLWQDKTWYFAKIQDPALAGTPAEIVILCAASDPSHKISRTERSGSLLQRRRGNVLRSKTWDAP